MRQVGLAQLPIIGLGAPGAAAAAMAPGRVADVLTCASFNLKVKLKPGPGHGRPSDAPLAAAVRAAGFKLQSRYPCIFRVTLSRPGSDRDRAVGIRRRATETQTPCQVPRPPGPGQPGARGHNHQ